MNEKKSGLSIKILMLLVIAIAFGLYLYVNTDKSNKNELVTPTYSMQATDVIVPYEYSSRAQVYAASGGHFYFATKDGISYRGADGKPKWHDSFDMNTPLLLGNGNYAIVAEIKNKAVYVYGPTGRLYETTFEHPIYNFAVYSNGFSGVIYQTPLKYFLEIYDDKGKLINERSEPIGNIFPLVSSLSSDGKILAFSSLDISGVQMTSVLVFADTQGSNPIDKIEGYIGGEKKDNQLIVKLGFLENDMLISMSDTEICGYERLEDDKIRSKWTLPLTNEIKFMEYAANKGFVMVHGKKFKNQISKQENTVEFYNNEGQMTGTYIIPKDVTYLSASSNGAIVGCGTSYYAFNMRGQLLWEWSATMDLKQVLFLGATDRILAVGNTEAIVMKYGRK